MWGFFSDLLGLVAQPLRFVLLFRELTGWFEKLCCMTRSESEQKIGGGQVIERAGAATDNAK